MVMVAVGTPAVASSKRQSCTAVAFSEKRAKLTPSPFQVAPSGCGLPGQTLTVPPRFVEGGGFARDGGGVRRPVERYAVRRWRVFWRVFWRAFCGKVMGT